MDENHKKLLMMGLGAAGALGAGALVRSRLVTPPPLEFVPIQARPMKTSRPSAGGSGGGSASEASIVSQIIPPDAQFLPKPGTGPLPPPAFLTFQESWGTKVNHPKHKGMWFDINKAPSAWWDKVEKLRFFADPPGTRRAESEIREFNVGWMARCDYPNDYPLYGHKDRSCRVRMLNDIIGRGADIKALGKSLSIWLSTEAMKKRLEAARISVGAVLTLGGSLLVEKGEKRVEKLVDAVASDVRIAGRIIDRLDDRVQAAGAVIEVFGWEYVDQLKAANPHAVKNGRLDISKSYFARPQTWEDLARPGNAYPKLYNPPADISAFWPMRTQTT